MKIRTAILLLITGLLLATNLVVLIVASSLVDRAMKEGFEREGDFLAGTVSSLVSRAVIDRNLLAVTAELRKMVDRTPNIIYAYVVDFDGRLFAHSFEKGFPRDLLELSGDGEQSPHIRTASYFFGKVPVFEISCPLIEGMAARFHIGFDESAVAQARQALFNKILLAFVLVLAVSLGLGFILARRLSRPLTDFAQRLAGLRGKEGLAAVEIRGGLPEEVAELMASFNRMAADRRAVEKERVALSCHQEALLAAVPDILVEVDCNKVYTWANPAGFAFFGDDCIGRQAADFFEGEQDTYQQVEGLFDGSADLIHLESWQRRRDGQKRLLAWWCRALIDEEGRVTGALSLGRDITEQHQAEIKLRASAKALREAQEAGQVGLYIFDVQAGTWTSSAVLDAIFGIGPDFARTTLSWTELIHPAQRQEMLDYLATILARHQRFERECRIIRPDDGVERWVLWIGEVEYDYEEVPLFMVGTIQDVTERRKLEEQIRQAQKMESVGTLASGIAHDFNNILTAIMGYGQITLLDLAPDDSRRANVQGILDAATRGAQLTRDILLFSRKQVSDRRSMDLNEIIRTLEKFLKRVIGEDIVCRVSLPEQPVRIMADGHQIEQILMNLATNARDAMSDGGEFNLTVERTELRDDFVAAHGFGRPGLYAVLIVTDTGRGMTEEVRQRVFEPFFTTKEIEKGTGLGMAVVYGIVKQHDGYVNVYSEPGRGTTFRIYLPLLAEEETKGGVEVKAVGVELPPGGAETILLAEDDDQTRKMIRMVLEQFGYTVIEAVDGEEALREFVANRARIDLLFFDLIMPEINGVEAYEAIRRLEPGVKILFTSGYAEETLRQKAGLTPGTPLLVKPSSPVELLKQVRAVLDAPTG